jgi:hypothetical protein
VPPIVDNTESPAVDVDEYDSVEENEETEEDDET